MQSIYTDASVYKLLTPQDDAEHAFMPARRRRNQHPGAGERLRQPGGSPGATGRRHGRRRLAGDGGAGHAGARRQAGPACPGRYAHAAAGAPVRPGHGRRQRAAARLHEALYAALDSIRAHMGARALFQTGLRRRDNRCAESRAAKVGSATDASGVTFEIYGTSTFDPATRVNHRVFEIQGRRQGGRAHAVHAHPRFRRAPAGAGARRFSIARAFDESGQEVEPQARPGPARRPHL